MGAHWILQIAASHWNWLDPTGMFEAVTPSSSFVVVNLSSAYLLYIPRALVTVFPTVFVLREWDAAQSGQKMGQFRGWFAPIPRIALLVLDVALVFAVGPVGVWMQGTRWLDIKHATTVAVLVSALHAVFLGLTRRWPSQRQAVGLGDEVGCDAEDMEKGAGAAVSPKGGTSDNANEREHPQKPHAILLMTVFVTMPLTVIGLISYTAYASFLAHWLLRITAPRWLNPEAFQAASLQSTISTTRLGALFIVTPRIAIWMLPILFTLDECADTNSIKPVGRWWARNMGFIPPVVLSMLDKGLLVAAGPVGVWLGHIWPSGEPGLDVGHATIVAVVARLCMNAWEAALGKVLQKPTKVRPIEV